MNKTIVAPSVLSADFANLQHDIERINSSAAQWVHLDIMDGNFVPNISFGFPVVSSIRKLTDKILDVHLMIEKPERYINEFKVAGADILTVHYEACPHLHRVLQQIKATGMKAGVALNPHTPASVLTEVSSMVDMVLIMSVNPGFGGQKFIENTNDKVKRTKKLLADANSNAIIEVDGGITNKNAASLKKLGVTSFVAGSYLFKAKNINEAILSILNA